jgi:hypothetical protein
MRDEIRERRRKLFFMVTQGVERSKVISRLSTEYGVAESTVKKDWYNRKKWLSEVFDVEDSEHVIADILSEQKLVKREKWKLYRQSDKDSIKLGALKGIESTNENLLDMLQSIGRVDEEPQKMEMDISADDTVEKYAELFEGEGE